MKIKLGKNCNRQKQHNEQVEQKNKCLKQVSENLVNHYKEMTSLARVEFVEMFSRIVWIEKNKSSSFNGITLIGRVDLKLFHRTIN